MGICQETVLKHWKGGFMIKIYTLGDFDIKIEDKSILQSLGNQPKLMKLFKYFLTFQGRKLLPENIIEDIWQDENFKDPLNVLRTQISRVRNMIDLKKYGIESFFYINYLDGYYLFQLEDNCSVDFMQVESCMEKYNSLKDKDAIMEACKLGIKMYKGEYLGELGDEDWLIPVRSRLDRLYIKSLSSYLQLLKEDSMDNHIVAICEEAMRYRPYEEIIHVYFIEALINLGQNRYALNHYRYYTSKIYSELRESPSNKMKILYKRIKSKEGRTTSPIDLDTLEDELSDSGELKGALLCDNYYFKFLYNLEIRNVERCNKKVFTGVITIDSTGHRPLSEEDMKDSMSILLDIIYERLRKGDVLTQWNQSQVLLLLYSLEEENIETVAKRLDNRFKELIKNQKIGLNIKFKKI